MISSLFGANVAECITEGWRLNQYATLYGKEWKLWKRRTFSTSHWDKDHVDEYWQQPDASHWKSGSGPICYLYLHMPVIDPSLGVTCVPLGVTDTEAFINVIRTWIKVVLLECVVYQPLLTLLISDD